jgi:uncharacterized coiled-coil protein SlyX
MSIHTVTKRTAIIAALEELNLPLLPAEVRTMIDANQAHLSKLLRALADELERPGTGMPVIDLMPPSARALGARLHSEPSLLQAGLLETLKGIERQDEELQRLTQRRAELERARIPDSQLN